MNQTIRIPTHLPGYSQTELVIGFFLVASLLLGLLYIVDPFSDADDFDGTVPSYRVANAMYVYNALERQRVAVLTFRESYGALPGDSEIPWKREDGTIVRGNQNGHIEREQGEAAKVFPDLYEAAINPAPVVRVRGKNLELYETTLRAGATVLGKGHFFCIKGLNELEAIAFDIKYDDGFSDSGNAVFAKGEGDTVDLYYKLNLYQ